MPREEGDTFLRWSLSQRQVACSPSLPRSASFAGSVRRLRRWERRVGVCSQPGRVQNTDLSALSGLRQSPALSSWQAISGKRWQPKRLAYPFFWGWSGSLLAGGIPDTRAGCATHHPSTQYRCSQLNRVSNLKPLPLQKAEGMDMAELWRTWPVGSDLREGLAKRSKLWARRVMELDRKHFPSSCAVSFPCDKVYHT